MFDKILYFLFFTSSYGLYLIENGAFSPTLMLNGYKNGVLYAYLVFWGILFTIYYLTKKSKISFTVKKGKKEYDYMIYSKYYFIILIFLLIVILFVFGAYKIWTGEMGKGEFRSSGIGFFGSFAYGISKFVVPAIGVFQAYLYTRIENKKVKHKNILILNFLIIFLVGSSWGFKSFGVFLLLPGLTIIFWDLSFIVFLLMASIGLLLMIFAALLFDAKYNLNFYTASEFILTRITVMQGEVPWKIWDLYINEQLNISYAQTLLPVLGNKVLYLLTGLDNSNGSEWISYNYGLLLTDIVSTNKYNILHGHNVTGTLFSEAIIALGYLGILVFSLLAGFLVGLFYNTVNNGMKNNNPLVVSVALVYYYSIIYAWIKSGGIVSLIHVANIINIVMIIIVLNIPRIRSRL